MVDDTAGQFRDAMRRVAATVNIVTVYVDGTPMGMTATAVSSISFNPPSLLMCVNQSASMHDSLALATHFCVNVLHQDHLELSRTFSNSKLRDIRFADEKWARDDDGSPYLPDAQASFRCERSQLIAFGTHTICVGTIVKVRMREDINPLIYLDGTFGKMVI